MNEFDIARTYTEVQLRKIIRNCVEERDFWFALLEGQPNSSSLSYYKAQYTKYNERLKDLRNLLKEMVYD
jgi:hypothetical protein